MEPFNLLDVTNWDQLRAWLEVHHRTKKECWVVVKRGRPIPDETFWYIDAVEEALCFGWIDSTTKATLDELKSSMVTSEWLSCVLYRTVILSS